MKLSWDEAKRQRTLIERQLDFADVGAVLGSPHFDIPDDRADYGEARTLTFGLLKGRLVAVVWTPRDGGRRIISLRHANDRERARFEDALR